MDPFAMNKGQLLAEVIRLKKRNEELERLIELVSVPTNIYTFLLDTIIALSATAREVEPETGEHQDRVAELARTMAVHMNLSAKEIDSCYIGAQLHDIGKISHLVLHLVVSGKCLNADEWRDMKCHPVIGGRILREFECPWRLSDIVWDHHERLDGSGYPAGKTAENISLETGVVSVADVVEAMSARRPYRTETPGLEKALNHIRKYSGILYHADAAVACREVFENGFVFPGAKCVQ